MKYYYECPHCRGKAFLYGVMPVEGEPALSVLAKHVDGRPMELHAEPTCDSCGAALGQLMTRNLKDNEDE